MMQFLVLGYVPGTNVQIGFETIATLFLVAGLVYLLRLLHKEHSRILQRAIETIQYMTI